MYRPIVFVIALFVTSSASAQDIFDLSDPVEVKPATPGEQAGSEPSVVDVDPFSLDSPVAPEPVTRGKNWVLIICGHPGNVGHRILYAESIEEIYSGLTTNCGIAPENIIVQFGSEINSNDGPAIASARGEATRDELAAQVAELKGRVAAEDTLWTIVLGHAYYDGRNTFLNIPGADVHQDDFAAWFADMPGRQVFMITTAVSGYFVRPLSGDNRYIITATPPDSEVNETIFHLALAETLATPPTMEEFDADADGKATLFDFYITLTRNIAQRYVDENLLATEHSVLDDNGDGRGMEIQIDYLSVEQGGREREEGAPAPKIRPNSDGFRSTEFDFSMLTLAEPMEEPAEEVTVEEEPAEEEPAEEKPEPSDNDPDAADAESPDPEPEATDDDSEGNADDAPAPDAAENDAM